MKNTYNNLSLIKFINTKSIIKGKVLLMSPPTYLVYSY